MSFNLRQMVYHRHYGEGKVRGHRLEADVKLYDVFFPLKKIGAWIPEESLSDQPIPEKNRGPKHWLPPSSMRHRATASPLRPPSDGPAADGTYGIRAAATLVGLHRQYLRKLAMSGNVPGSSNATGVWLFTAEGLAEFQKRRGK